jgi:RNA polymerase sigma factor (sigma-70 family)
MSYIRKYLKEIRGGPSPTEDELQLLLIKAKEGCRDSFGEFIDYHLPFVISRAKKFVGQHGIELDDLIQEGNLGLLKAYQKYNQLMGAFTTYSKWWIDKRIREYVKSEQRRSGIEIEYEYTKDENPQLDYDYVYTALDALSIIEQAIVSYRYGLGVRERTFKEIGELLGMSTSHAHGIFKSTLKKLKLIIKEEV